MKKYLATFALLLSLSPLIASAQSVSPLPGFISTSSPTAGITQRKASDKVIITGLTTGLCLTLDSNDVLTTTSCGSGGSTPGGSVGNIQYYGSGGVFAGVASSSLAFSSEFSGASSLGALVGGTNSTVSLATNGIAYSKLVQANANTILGNNTGALANIVAFATSTLGIALSDTTGTLAVNRGGTNNASLGGNLILYTNAAGTQVLGAATSSLGSITVNSTNSTLTVGGSPASLGGTLTADLNLAHSNTWSALQSFAIASSSELSVFQKAFFGGTATTTFDSAGNEVIPSGSNLTITGKSDGCATFASGVLNSTGIACGTGGGTGLATSSPIAAGNLLEYSAAGPGSAFGIATSSFSLSGSTLVITGTLGALVGGNTSTIALNLANANTWTAAQTFNQGATTTDLSVSHMASTSLLVASSLHNGFVFADANGSTTASTSIGTNFISNPTISGITLGGTLGALSHGSTLTGTSYTGASAVSNWDIDLTHANTWTGTQTFNAGATTTDLGVSHMASTTLLTVSGLHSGFVQVDANGSTTAAALTSGQITTALGFTPFGGTNPLPTANGGTNNASLPIDSLLYTNHAGTQVIGVATSSLTLAISGHALGTSLSALSHDSTLTGTNFDGSTAVSNWGIDLTHANTWTGAQTLNNGATTTSLFVSGKAGIGTSTPWARLAVNGQFGDLGPLFAVATTTLTGSTTLFQITQSGIASTSLLVVSGLHAGFVQTDASGSTTAAALTSSQITTALGFTPFGGTNPLPVANGGTNDTSLTGDQLLYSNHAGTQVISISTTTLTGTSITVGGSGAVVGGAGLTVNLNLANQNNWSVLQTFTNASSSLFSVFQKAYFGGTATTTIDSAGNIVIPSGSNLTITGKSDGCATFASGVLNSTGSACGGAGSSPGGPSNAVQFNGGGTFAGSAGLSFVGLTDSLGIGTSTPWGQFSVLATSTTSYRPLVVVASSTAGTATSTFFLINNGGDIGVSSSSPGSLFSIGNTGGINFTLATTTHYTTGGLDLEGGGCFSVKGVCVGGGSGTNYFTNSGIYTSLSTGINLGIGSSTPWAQLSVASSTYNGAAAYPLFAVATSSDMYGALFNIYATSSIPVPISTSPWQQAISGSRVEVGTNSQYGYAGGLDNFFVNGTVSTGDWHFSECSILSSSGALSAQTTNVCGSWIYYRTTAGQLTVASTNGYISLQSGNTTGAIDAVADPVMSTQAKNFATSTPIFEALLSRGESVAQRTSTTTVFLGLTNGIGASPGAGCYFVASSTRPDWAAVCGTSSTATTVIGTGISSSTQNLIRFRIEADNVSAKFYMQVSTSTMQKVATISTTYPSTTGITPIVDISQASPGTATTPAVIIAYIRYWYRDGVSTP